jgi:HD-GYP domain-containing protein (c-di-GMP phosphodiesterase class II)
MIGSPPRIRFHVGVIAAILVVVLIMTVATIAIVLAVAKRSVERTAEELFTAAGRFAGEQVASPVEIARAQAWTASSVPGAGAPIGISGMDHPFLPYMHAALEATPILYSLYVGRDTGDFLQLIATRDNDAVIAAHSAPPDTVFILRAISRSVSGRQQIWSFLDADGELISGRTEDDPTYDPTARSWYGAAISLSPPEEVALTDPYVFNSLQALGFTASRTLADGGGVVGVDVTLAGLQEFVTGLSVSEGGGLALVGADRVALAFSPRLATLLGASPAIGSPLPARFADVPAGISRLDDTESGEWLLWSGSVASDAFPSWRVIAGAPVADFLGPYRGLRNRVVIAAFLLLLVAVPFVVWISRTLSRVVSTLAEDAQRITDLDFSSSLEIRTPIIEFHDLADGFARMKSTLAARTRDLSASMDQLAKIIELNIAISAESDINRLSELILTGARTLANADAGSLYLKNQEGTHLEFQIVLNETLGFFQGGTSGDPVTLPPVPLYTAEGSPNDHNVVTHAFHTGETFNIADAYNATDFDFSGTRRFDEANGYRSKSMLTVPLKPRGSGIIGAMQLLNRIDPETGEIGTFSPEIQRFVEALAAGAATALYNRDLIEAQKRLFDAMIRLIAGAIDAKSPYTGGHCARVPVLAMMLGKEAEAVTEGPLAEFAFASEQDWRAFRIGAWLHDAGKVTTPDYVFDKSTKLETIYNRIHEIRTRFEVALRDAQIERHEAVLSGADPKVADEKLAEVQRELQEDFAFIAECNLGGEMMAQEQIDRLKRIAERSWMRFFDDTLGLSWEEANRLPEDRARDLPVRESLLADKPEHVIPRTSGFYEAYDGFGFAIPVPEALYNRGEVYNLSVGRGTLTEEERFKINEHVMQTITMLEDLPFPEELRRVPEYAGTHHEALDGSGYPRRLSGDDLSIPARIMAIADIFEALTASDRPYKRAKPLSVAVDILYRFKQDGHIDPELFNLFLTSGAYRRYAEEHLKPEQLDDVNISKYL